jgi:hypothetical protein
MCQGDLNTVHILTQTLPYTGHKYVLSHGNHSEILETGSAIIVFPHSDLQCSLDWVI